jgi:hypothetical protein
VIWVGDVAEWTYLVVQSRAMQTILRLLALLLMLSSLAVCGESGWSNLTGNDLLPTCMAAVDFLDNKDLSRDRGSDALQCLHYAGGFLDGYEMASTVEKGKPALCFPKNTNTGQVVRVFVKWMKDHPEKLNEPAGDCVSAALVDAFACKYPK